MHIYLGYLLRLCSHCSSTFGSLKTGANQVKISNDPRRIDMGNAEGEGLKISGLSKSKRGIFYDKFERFCINWRKSLMEKN